MTSSSGNGAANADALWPFAASGGFALGGGEGPSNVAPPPDAFVTDALGNVEIGRPASGTGSLSNPAACLWEASLEMLA